MNREEILTRTALTNAESAEMRVKGEGESRTITGYAILFNTPSDVLWQDESGEAREEIAPEAITRELLDGCDIKFTMFHDRQLILARSRNGKGSLTYQVDEKGVSFSFEAPNTADGDKALELVKRGDIAGCSFMFATPYWDRDYVERSCKSSNGKKSVTYRVKKVTSVMDFTLAADPAYPDTSVSAREKAEREAETPKDLTKAKAQWDEMRRAAAKRI